MADEQQAAPRSEAEDRSIQPLKFYLKDVSFETPNSPGIFLKKWNPHLELEVSNSAALTNDGHHEVVLLLTVTVTVDGETAYLAEVHQAGIFSITGVDQEQTQQIHHVFCNRQLYPYACAALSDLVSKGGFPQLLLQPINFNLMYKKRLEQARAAETTPAED
jgi:preprotein translocase subunit SecB